MPSKMSGCSSQNATISSTSRTSAQNQVLGEKTRDVQAIRIWFAEDRNGGGEQQPRQNEEAIGQQPTKIDCKVIEDIEVASREQIIGMIADVLNRVWLVLGEAALERKLALRMRHRGG